MSEYYSTCPFPKPKTKKKKPLYNGYKDKANRYCIYCGEAYAERHEVFPGTANRQISIENKFQVDLCPAHHAELQDNVTEWAKKENVKLKRYFQRRWEREMIEKTGISEDNARTMWIEMIGRSYL